MRKLIIITFFSVLSWISVFATDFPVSNNADAGAGSLRQAIIDANTAGGSVVHTITPTGVLSITLLSALPDVDCNLKINGSVSDNIVVNAFAGSTIIKTINSKSLELNYVKLQGAVSGATNGGALNITGATTLNNCTLISNKANFGAAVYIAAGGSLTCESCTINSNENTSAGATIYTEGGVIFSDIRTTVSLNSCEIKNNTGKRPIIDLKYATDAASKGGISILNISNSVISNNVLSITGSPTANQVSGGGVSAAAVVDISNCVISGNSAPRGGGLALQVGTSTYKSKLTMNKCLVSGNTSTGRDGNANGGGIYIAGSAGATGNTTNACVINNTTISGNICAARGGTVANSMGGGLQIGSAGSATWLATCTLNNCTVVSNTSGGTSTDVARGGGVDRSYGTLILNYCIVANNNSSSTAANRDIHCADATFLGSATGRNLYGGTATFSKTGMTETTGNVNVADGTDIATILNPTLADNGGTTTLPGGGYVKTHALVSGSSAINPTAASTGLQTVDQRGVNRDATPDMGSCEFISSASSITTGTADWSSTTAWINNSIPSQGANVTVQNELNIDQNVSVGTLTVNAGKMLTLNSGKSLTAVNLTLNSAENVGTATFVDKNTNGELTVTGATNVNQFVSSAGIGSNGRNWYISSPLTAATSSIITTATGNGLVYYDGTTNWPAAGATMQVMKGYIAKSPAANATINFNGGTLNTGAQSLVDMLLGFNLVGNPYASYVDFAQATKTNVLSSIWYRSKKNNNTYNFHTYNVIGGISINDGTPIIAPMQSFWIKTTSATNTFGFTNAMRLHQDQSVAGNRLKAPKVNTQPLLRLQVSNGTNKDETVLYFNPNAQNSVDDYDSQKYFNNVAEVPEIYTKNGSANLVINGMNTIPYNTEIPLGFTTGLEGSFSLSTTEFVNFEPGTHIVLKDKTQPANETELSQGVVYNFDAGVSTVNNDRFSLVFRTTGVNTYVNTVENTNIQVFVNVNNQISINAPQKSNYAIYNMVGENVDKGVTTSYNQTLNRKLTKGVYIVKVENLTKRVLVK